MTNAERLRAFLASQSMSTAAFARRLGGRVSTALVGLLVAGTHKPAARELAIAIERETRGAVPASAWPLSAKRAPRLGRYEAEREHLRRAGLL